MQGFQHYLLLIYRLFSLYRCCILFDACMAFGCDGDRSLPVVEFMRESIVFLVRVQCRR